MLTHYETEWMAKERMKEIEQWIRRKTLEKQNRSTRRSVPFCRRVLTWLRRK